MKRYRLKWGFLLLLFPLASTLLASRPQEVDKKFLIEAGYLEKAPVIDGHIGNPEWSSAAVVEDFVQYEPQEGSQPSEKTVVWIGYDQKYLYIAFRCFDSHPDGIRCSLCQRDRVQGDDVVSVYLDTFNDKKRAFVFQLNPKGVQVDGVYVESMPGSRRGRGRGEGFDRIDRNWNAYFKSAASKDQQGYTVEMAIPFKSLRFPNLKSQIWGIILRRQIPRKNEDLYWPPRSRNVNGLLIQAGQLIINQNVERGRNLELMPSVIGSKASNEKAVAEIGANIKYGITSNITADLALNPDFSQIEADMPQNDVNQRYALYYPEKRPFFLEGKDIFDTPIELVYTRKIVSPVWAAKVSGKVNKTSFGLISALDDLPVAIEIPDAPEFDDTLSYHSLNNIFRLRQDLFSESYFGFLLADKEMGQTGSSLFTDYNRLIGVDGLFKFLDYNRLSFQLVGSKSRVQGIETAWAPAFSLTFNHQSRHLGISLDWNSIHPDFEAGLGFIRRKDIHSLNSRVGYTFLPENDLVISVTPSISYRQIYDFNHTLTDRDVDYSLMINGWRQTFIFLNYSDSFEKYNGVDLKPREFRGSLFSAPFSWLSGRVMYSFGRSIYYSDEPYLGYRTSLQTELNLRPLTSILLSYSFENTDFYEKKGGEKVYQVMILSQRLNIQFNKNLFLRIITDYNDYHQKIYLSGLIGYELNPGTVFYLGVEDNREKDITGHFLSTGRYYFMKFSYWWRI